MTASILHFPLSNQKADRAFWKGPTPDAGECEAAVYAGADDRGRVRGYVAKWMEQPEVRKAFHRRPDEDTAPSEYNSGWVSDSGDESA